MTSRSDCEPLPKPTLSPFALARPGTFLRVGFFHCRRVVCACSAGTVGSFSNKPLSQKRACPFVGYCGLFSINYFRKKPTPPPLPNPQVTLPSTPPPLCHPRSRFSLSAAVWSMPLCGHCGFCFSINYFRKKNKKNTNDNKVAGERVHFSKFRSK